jgi:hypothetical protein
VRSVRILVGTFAASKRVVTAMVYIHLQAAARERMRLWGYFVLDPDGPPRMVGNINTAARVVLPNVSDEYFGPLDRLEGSDIPLPLSMNSRRTWTECDSALYTAAFSCLMAGKFRPAATHLQEVFNHCIGPQLFFDEERPLLDPLTPGFVFDDAALKDLRWLWKKDYHASWARLGQSLATQMVADIRSMYTNSFGQRLELGIGTICAALRPYMSRKTAKNLKECITAWFQPYFLIHARLHPDSQWSWTENHPVFRLENREWRQGLEDPRVRARVLNAFGDLFRLLI